MTFNITNVTKLFTIDRATATMGDIARIMCTIILEWDAGTFDKADFTFVGAGSDDELSSGWDRGELIDVVFTTVDDNLEKFSQYGFEPFDVLLDFDFNSSWDLGDVFNLYGTFLSLAVRPTRGDVSIRDFVVTALAISDET